MHFEQLVDFITRPVNKTCLDHVYCHRPQRIGLVTSHDIGLADRVCSSKSVLVKIAGPLEMTLESNCQIVHAWEDIFNYVLDLHCPWRDKGVKHVAPAPWITKEMIKQLHACDHLLKVTRRSDWANITVLLGTKPFLCYARLSVNFITIHSRTIKITPEQFGRQWKPLLDLKRVFNK